VGPNTPKVLLASYKIPIDRPSLSVTLLLTTSTLALSYLTQLFALTSQWPPNPLPPLAKAPASTASKAPAKSTEGAKAAKKTSSKPAGEETGEKKKRRKVRKETYSSYIYKGELIFSNLGGGCELTSGLVLKQVHPDTGQSPTKRWRS